jgi:phenylalanine-4-hydroxylase
MSEIVEKLPDYLKTYCTEQSYEKYTPQDQAAWRFIMRQNIDFFSKHAVSVYKEGLVKTGISPEYIPKISEMDQALSKLGWGAVPVCGFIPPAVFLEFQARGVLPIATDMRTINHLAYTPAPDIVHEAAGHAPIIADPAYAEYLKRYARMAQRAIISADDIDVYEAIRYLSDIKENPDTPPHKIAEAEERLKRVSAAVRDVSEAAKIARMSWWTVEYGLVGQTGSPKIYGAGLLSSVGESQACLSDSVPKIPLTVSCVDVSYDITRPQPQLFVAKNMAHLVEVLEELDKTLSYVIGGTYGMTCALESKVVNTIVLDSGIATSGKLVKFEKHGNDVYFFKCEGPVQLSHSDQELNGHGIARHGHGFSSPIGRWLKKREALPQNFSDTDLRTLGLEIGKKSTLQFVSGFEVTGTIESFTRLPNGSLGMVTWNDCTVMRGSEKYYDPSWGPFDMIVGCNIVSVHGGPADRQKYGEYRVGNASSQPGRTSPFSEQEKQIFKVYQTLRDWRKSSPSSGVTEIKNLGTNILTNFKHEWLLALEMIEVIHKLGLYSDPTLVPTVKELESMIKTNKDIGELGQKGLALARH